MQALIIDDDIFSLEVLGRLLASQNISATQVNDTAQLTGALANAASLKVVFLDLEMPKMNGYDAFKVIKAKLPAGVPIVAYTAHLNEFQNARSLGFHSFICKPLDLEKFPDQLRQILAGQRVWDV